MLKEQNNNNKTNQIIFTQNDYKNLTNKIGEGAEDYIKQNDVLNSSFNACITNEANIYKTAFNQSVASLGDLYKENSQHKNDYKSFDGRKVVDINFALNQSMKREFSSKTEKENSCENSHFKINDVYLNDIPDPLYKIDIEYQKPSKTYSSQKFSHIVSGKINPVKSQHSIKPTRDSLLKEHQEIMDNLVVYSHKVDLKEFENFIYPERKRANSKNISITAHSNINENNKNNLIVVSNPKPIKKKVNKEKKKILTEYKIGKYKNLVRDSENLYKDSKLFFDNSEKKLPQQNKFNILTNKLEHIYSNLDFLKSKYNKQVNHMSNNLLNNKNEMNDSKLKQNNFNNNNNYERKNKNNLNYEIDINLRKNIEEKLELFHIELRNILDSLDNLNKTNKINNSDESNKIHDKNVEILKMRANYLLQIYYLFNKKLENNTCEDNLHKLLHNEIQKETKNDYNKFNLTQMPSCSTNINSNSKIGGFVDSSQNQNLNNQKNQYSTENLRYSRSLKEDNINSNTNKNFENPCTQNINEQYINDNKLKDFKNSVIDNSSIPINDNKFILKSGVINSLDEFNKSKMTNNDIINSQIINNIAQSKNANIESNNNKSYGKLIENTIELSNHYNQNSKYENITTKKDLKDSRQVNFKQSNLTNNSNMKQIKYADTCNFEVTNKNLSNQNNNLQNTYNVNFAPNLTPNQNNNNLQNTYNANLAPNLTPKINYNTTSNKFIKMTSSNNDNIDENTYNSKLINKQPKINTKSAVRDDLFTSYDIELPVDYYYHLSKDQEPKTLEDWYFRKHHTETSINNKKAIADDLLNTKYISYYKPDIKEEKKDKVFMIDEIITNLNQQINKLKINSDVNSLKNKDVQKKLKDFNELKNELSKNYKEGDYENKFLKEIKDSKFINFNI